MRKSTDAWNWQRHFRQSTAHRCGCFSAFGRSCIGFAEKNKLYLFLRQKGTTQLRKSPGCPENRLPAFRNRVKSNYASVLPGHGSEDPKWRKMRNTVPLKFGKKSGKHPDEPKKTPQSPFVAVVFDEIRHKHKR